MAISFKRFTKSDYFLSGSVYLYSHVIVLTELTIRQTMMCTFRNSTSLDAISSRENIWIVFVLSLILFKRIIKTETFSLTLPMFFDELDYRLNHSRRVFKHLI